jgi:glycosyltransferase involved in cell wall biosynthesis/ADP-heptose:LPS heptosyltransferase
MATSATSKTMPSKPRLLVIELWGLGDLAIATPFLQAASERFAVTLLAKPYGRDMAARLWPLVNVVPFVAPWTAFRHKYRIFTWPWKELFWLRNLRDTHYEVGLSARWDPRDHFLLYVFRARRRIGFPRVGSRILLTDQLARPEPAAHRYEYWRALARALDLDLPSRTQMRHRKMAASDLIVIHSGAGQPVRVWPLARYQALVKRLRLQNHRVMVACDPDQRGWWRAAGETDAATPSTVNELIGLLDGTGAFIGNDSGPGHLAAILGVPTFTVFGPQLPEWFAPLHPSAEWLAGLPCPYKPCSDYCRLPEPICIQGLDEESVGSRVDQFVARNLVQPSVWSSSPAPVVAQRSRQEPVKLAFSILCENPTRRTGLSTLFPAFVEESLRQFPEVKWLIFAGPNQPWPVIDDRVEVVRQFPANDRLLARLKADHFQVASEAKRRGAAALLTVGFCPLRTARLPTVMHVFTVHHLRPGGGLRAAYRRWATKNGLRRASLVIANSQWTAGQLSVNSSRLLVSYEGLQPEFFRADGPTDPSLPAGSYLLWASNFYPYKRAELSLGAYARLPADLRSKFPLMLVGGDWKGGRIRAEETARQLGLSRDVRFLGWVADATLPGLYRGARAHILSTAEETFGRTVLEAMACGCPCILQDLPVLREVTAGSAVFVDFNDLDAAGAALKTICTDDTLVERLRAAGVERARQFSFARLAVERVEAILRMLGVNVYRRTEPIGAFAQQGRQTSPASEQTQ